MSSSDPKDSEASKHKLPREHARRRSNNRNEWTAADAAERRKPIIALIIIGVIVLAGIALMVGGFSF